MSKYEDEYIFHKRYKPLPVGYNILQLDSGHFMFVKGDYESSICWDKWQVRRWVFEHSLENKKQSEGGV